MYVAGFAAAEVALGQHLAVEVDIFAGGAQFGQQLAVAAINILDEHAASGLAGALAKAVVTVGGQGSVDQFGHPPSRLTQVRARLVDRANRL